MSREAILIIKETEARAEQIVRDAQARARQMREDAERDGRSLCERTESEVLAQRAEMLKQIEVKSEELLARTLEEAREEADALSAAVSLRRRIGEKIIIRGLDTKCR